MKKPWMATAVLLVLVCAPTHGDDTQPPEPAELHLPPWLEPMAPAEPDHAADKPLGLRAAFELRSPPAPSSNGLEPAARPSVVSDVRPASAQILGFDDSPKALELLHADAANLAFEARSLGDFNDLIELCQPAIESGSPHAARLKRLAAWAYDRRGELRLDHDPHTAFDDFQNAVILDPRSAAALNHRGLVLAEHGKLAEAVEDFSRVLAIEPDHAAAQRNRAEALSQLGRYEEAIADLSAVIDPTAPDPAALAARGFAYHATGKLREALADLNQSIRSAPMESDTWTLRANVYAEAGFYQQAVDDLQQALRLDPASRSAYLSTAWLLATCSEPRHRDPKTALEAATRAKKLAKELDAHTLDVLAAAHASAGEFESAVRYQEQALLLAADPQQTELRERLARYRRGESFRR
ncbi:lipoprotein NlpI [Pirellulimonas nuda]|uniref:Lipoprotein NlpI n=1 Tax=Pirellulimonas nuda TaxID=2528009 RepID=A0A518D5F2_9BACT|nr:tetratricopeptide repeat protein [Pirellulimonas nuda]QDU86705.1 lipoprotein NlpI [Pirellulimonas nuda]